MHFSEENRDFDNSERTALVRALYNGKLFPDDQIRLFRGAHQPFPTRAVKRGKVARELVSHDFSLERFEFTSRGKLFDLYDYVSQNRVTGLLVLKGNHIALEHYEAGNTDRTRWLSMSMAKSVSSTLVGIALRDRHIRALSDLLTDYVADLRNGPYEGVSIRDLLTMQSGVRWNETYTDPVSDRRRMLELQIAQKPDAILREIASLPRSSAPGSVWNYSTGETHVLGALLRSATGRWLSDYLSEKVWSAIGMEEDASWWLESPDGLEVAGSGLSATLRDYGRFGLFLADDGCIDDVRLLPEGWVKLAGAPQVIGGRTIDYGFMWWPVPSAAGSSYAGGFRAGGIFGQRLYINPAERVVIVVWSVRSKPQHAEAIDDNDFFNAIVARLGDEGRLA
ncbi:MAG: serine hydrolase [Rhizomicrobium sp.]